MMNFKTLYIRIIVAFAALLSLASCSDDPSPTPDTEPDPATRHTVLVYMVADNSLGRGGYDQADLDEMVAGAQSGQLNASAGRWLVYRHAPGLSPQLLELQPKGLWTVLKTYDADEAYSVDVDRMRQVLGDVRDLAPAGHYGLVLWSHGSGWEESANSRQQSPMLYSYGDDRGVSMKVSSLARALEGYQHDYIYFDCCFMSTVEVAYELRGCTPLIMGSVAELPADGMPYHLNLKPLMGATGDYCDAVRNTFNLYDGMADPIDRTATMTALHTKGLERLAQVTREVMEKHFVSFGNVNASQIQMFMRSNRRNTLWDLRQYVTTLCGDDTELLNRWKTALADVVVYAQATPAIFGEVQIREHCGLGTYILQSRENVAFRGYENQSWFKDVVSAAPALN